jgi:hypothetical protein
VAAAETTAAGLQEPSQRSFKRILRSHGSEVDRFAARAVTLEEESDNGNRHDHCASGLTACDGISEYAGRLASRAALTCSGVLTSGCDTLIRSLARETLRLWRFCSRLSTDI